MVAEGGKQGPLLDGCPKRGTLAVGDDGDSCSTFGPVIAIVISPLFQHSKGGLWVYVDLYSTIAQY